MKQVKIDETNKEEPIGENHVIMTPPIGRKHVIMTIFVTIFIFSTFHL